SFLSSFLSTVKSLYQADSRRKRYGVRLQTLAMALSLLFTLVSCANDRLLVSPVPVISDDLDRESLRVAIRRSIGYLEKLPSEHIVGEQPRRFTAAEVLNSLVAFEKLLDHRQCRECWQEDFSARFDLIPSSGDPALKPVLFTGYYQPVIEGSLVATPEYAYPIYGVPADMVVVEEAGLMPLTASKKTIGRLEGGGLVPYYSRREIDELGSLRGRGYEIAWVKDPIDLFFLHIQGSGILQLEDGRRLLIGYAGSNGRAYRSIGRLLIDRGKIPQPEMSMQRLRRYLLEFPEERSEILSYNESYVFFRFLEEGPLGNIEVPLTAGRSIATDARLFPKGALAFIATETPVLDAAGQLVGWQPFSRFVLNQDTGGAIRGPQRVDLYFGTGAEAEGPAGYMNRTGKLYFLSLKNSPTAASIER
ncbi:MAG TPA: MltA domain-containing protein, partial [Candidatus Binatia bacterium]|nr:MltA domain-containing protein [Candidatus Binatia bacterium]